MLIDMYGFAWERSLHIIATIYPELCFYHTTPYVNLLLGKIRFDSRPPTSFHVSILSERFI